VIAQQSIQGVLEWKLPPVLLLVPAQLPVSPGLVLVEEGRLRPSPVLGEGADRPAYLCCHF